MARILQNGIEYNGWGSEGVDYAITFTATLTSSQYGWFTFPDVNGNALTKATGIPISATCFNNNNYWVGQFFLYNSGWIFKIVDVNASSGTSYYPPTTTMSNYTFTLSYIPCRTSFITEVVGTLTAGQTSITLSDSAITTTSTIDIYTTNGIGYNTLSVATGSVTITFDAQGSDIGVKVRVC
jgi:hypothetical protein